MKLNILIISCVIIISLNQTLFGQQINLMPYGDFDSWKVRIIDESFVIGGNTRYLYEVAPKDTVIGHIPYLSSGVSPWRTSNVMAKVSGVTKCSVTAFPEKRDNGYCVRLETRLEICKVLGLFNIKVLAAGTIFTGEMLEPIKDTKNPYSKMNAGIPFTDKPKAFVVDYKMKTSGEDHRVRASGFSKITEVPERDSAEIHIIFHKRWEDENGNVFAKRVGTAIHRFCENSSDWVNDYHVEILYGDITSHPDYRSYMEIIPEEKSLYCVNSKGETVPISEVGWAEVDEIPTHLVFRASSSHGEAYIGNIGNTFWLDNVRTLK